MGKVVTIGEAMGLLIAQTEGKLKDVAQFERFVAGAEVNVSVGVSRLGHEIQYITQVGRDPFGEHICDFLANEDIGTKLVHVSDEFSTGMQLKSKDTESDPDVAYFRKGSAASRMTSAILPEVDFAAVDVLHVTGIFMALNDTTYDLIKKLVEKAKAAGTLVTFDRSEPAPGTLGLGGENDQAYQ